MLTNMLYSISLQDFDIDKKETKRAVEDSLKDFHFSYWAVPSTAPADVVRMAGQTEHGHAFLQLSNKNVQLIISYDENYNKALSRCISYAHDKLVVLIDTLGRLKARTSFCGVVAQYVYDDIDDPMSYLKKILFIDTGPSILHNVDLRFSVVYKNMYYVNVELSVLSDAAHSKRALGVKVDVNNRYMLEKEDAISDANDIFEVVSLQESINQDVIMKLLHEGRLELNE